MRKSTFCGKVTLHKDWKYPSWAVWKSLYLLLNKTCWNSQLYDIQSWNINQINKHPSALDMGQNITIKMECSISFCTVNSTTFCTFLLHPIYISQSPRLLVLWSLHLVLASIKSAFFSSWKSIPSNLSSPLMLLLLRPLKSFF